MHTIYSYTDYRLFLKDFYAAKKEKNPKYSYRTFCRIGGISSPSLYMDVVIGKRNLTRKTIPLFIKGLKLNDEEGDYFSTLVLLNQAKTDKERLYLMDSLKRFIPGFNRKTVPLNQLAYYSKWYHSAIRELCCLNGWNGDYRKLSRMLVPHISTAEARESIKLLLKLGFIEKINGGKFRQCDPHIATQNDLLPLSIRALNRSLATMGRDAIDLFAPDERDCSGLILGLSKEGYSQIKEEIKEFKRKIVRITHHDINANQVYCMNMNFFPMSQSPAKKSGTK
ncbi:MAG: TIGR02147 family protein [Fibrobacteres bacterium]|nr:TIGR02147 family protein [Fibrobacterota bacterium]